MTLSHTPFAKIPDVYVFRYLDYSLSTTWATSTGKLWIWMGEWMLSCSHIMANTVIIQQSTEDLYSVPSAPSSWLQSTLMLIFSQCGDLHG